MAAPSFQVSPAKTSPALRAFELNPFRVLRLPVNISTNDAANQAESALTLERVGLDLSEPDPLPWLAPAGSYELQQAAQAMEEPLVRLKQQMLWFDCVRDPSHANLLEAIRNPRSGLVQQVLTEEDTLPPVEVSSQEIDSPSGGAAVPVLELGVAEQPPDVVDQPAENSIAAAPCPAETAGDTGSDLKYPLTINFWEAVRGSEATLKVAYSDDCPECGASGKAPGQTILCPSCKGNSKASRTCMRCDGSGRLPVNCGKCLGQGHLDRKEEINVKIPAGIQSGRSLRIPGKGLAGKNGAPAGDLYVAITVTPQEFYERRGSDLIVRLPLSPAEAAAGGEVDVPGLDGVLRIRYPQGCKAGQKFRVAGQGVWDIDQQRRGDLYIGVAILASEAKREPLRREWDGRVAQARSANVEPSPERRETAPARKFATRLSAPPDHALVARAVNHANLRLLMAAASIDGVAGGAVHRSGEPGKIAPSQWVVWNGFQRLSGAHLIVAGGTSTAAAPLDSQGYWGSGLQQWTAILDHPWFPAYLETCIADLGDDYVSADDVEAIVGSVKSYLADLSAQEARYLLLEGQYGPAGSMISAMADSGMVAQVLTPATRPLRNVFQSEISELEILLDEPGVAVMEAVDAYLKRLDAIKTRWTELDVKGVVGLRDLLDAAVEKAFLSLRNLEKRDLRLDALLDRAGKIASAQSLRERLTSFQGELAEERNRLCFFCKTEKPDYEKSVVLTGKKESHRSQSGNTTTIYYDLRYKLIFRCTRCARAHDFIRHTGLALWFVAIPGLLILGVCCLNWMAS